MVYNARDTCTCLEAIEDTYIVPVHIFY